MIRPPPSMQAIALIRDDTGRPQGGPFDFYLTKLAV